MVNFGFLRHVRFPRFVSRVGDVGGFCDVCGECVSFTKGEIIGEDLVKTWDITPQVKQAFDLRESMQCSNCQNSYRTRQLARALVRVFGKGKVRPLKQLVKSRSFRKLKIAEINQCGNLHPILKDLPNLHYSEYQGVKRLGSVRHENLESLTYRDEFFDLVLTSETLEHVSSLDKALSEIYRVLKPNGYHIFTVPVIAFRKTRERIVVRKDGVGEKLLPDSFHGGGEPDNLVYRDFGWDTPQLLERFGFLVRIYFYNPIKDDYSYVFVTQKPEKGRT